MAIVGVTFDNQSVTPKNDGKWYRKIMSDGIIQGCAITSSGDELYVAAGGIMVCGRYMELSSSQTIVIDQETTGYAQVKIDIDTTATATAETFEQVTFEVVYKSDTNFAALTQDDINVSSTNYEFELCTVSLDGGGINTILTYSQGIDTKINPESTSANIIEVIADKTLDLTDAGKVQKVNSASARVITIPLNAAVAFPIGTEIEIIRYGADTVTITITATGTIVCSESSPYTIVYQYTSAIIKKMDTDTWIVQGNIG